MAPFSKNMNEKNIHPTPEGVMCTFVIICPYFCLNIELEIYKIACNWGKIKHFTAKNCDQHRSLYDKKYFIEA